MKNELIQSFIEKHQLDDRFSLIALNWFIPLAELICANQSGEKKPFFIGLNGCQGSGKSTLTDFLQFYCQQVHDLNSAVMSLDDFYLSQDERSLLAKTVHPLLKTRGVPGTHDTKLMANALSALKNLSRPLVLPRFNKATDNPFPSSQWSDVSDKVDIVIVEGWCWGTPAQSELELVSAINELESQEDPDHKWRTYVNHTLIKDYQPLYEEMDFWIMLKAPSFDCVADWRKQQEHKLRANASANGSEDSQNEIMSDIQVERFIKHYQRLTEYSFHTIGKTADLIFNLDTHRNIVSIEGSYADSFNTKGAM